MVEETFPIITETVVGRTKEDLKKFGLKATGYIGKHIVGTGEETHLTTKVLIDLLRPHVILCCGKRGSGKCVTGDTLIYTTKGIVPIEKLVREKKRKSVISLNQENYEMSNSTAVEFFERKVDKVINIKLWNGLEVNTTENHPFLTIFGWREAKDINIGDFIAIPSKISVEETENSLSDSQIKLLAYFLSEGTIRKTFAWFTNSSKDLVNDFCDAVANFDSNLKIVEYGKFTYRVIGTKPVIQEKSLKFSPTGSFAQGSRIIVRRNTLLNWLKSLGVDKKSDDKFIPNVVFSLPSEKIALFLKCLFSRDGSFYEKKGKGKKSVFVMEYSSKSRTLIEGVYYLLLRFGITSYIRQKKVGDRNYYRLLISDKENIRKFLAAVGNFSRDEKLLQKFLKDERRYHSNYNLLPKEVWNYIRRKYKKKDIGKALGYKNWKGVSTKYKYNPLRATIRKIAEFFNDEYLLKISSPDIMWVKILEKKEINKPTKVYDISVTKHHNFVGNGIILHNSYSAAVILEEFCQLEEEFRKKLAFVVVDPMGIYWSMKFPNEQQASLLKEWNLEPKGFKDFVRVYVPAKQKEDYERAGIPVDGTILISLREFSAEDLILAFGLKRTEEIAIALEKNFNKLLSSSQAFGFEELIEEVRKDSETRIEVKNALISLLQVVEQWGLIAKEGIKLEDLVQAGKVTVIDLSRMPSFELRSLLVALLARKIYFTRVLARKEEERVKIEGGKPEITFPITWFVLEECLPFNAKVVTNKGIIPIGELVRRHKNGENFKVLSYDKNTGEYGYYDVVKSFEISPRELLKIKTETGKEIKCTPDHLVLSKNGFISAKDAEWIAAPLTYPYSQEKKLIIARIIGHLYGDGWLSKEEVGFSGSEDRDLLLIKNDLSHLGFSSSNIYERECESEVKTIDGKKFKIKGKGKYFSSSKKAQQFFSTLGVTIGNKTTQNFLLPKWLMESSKEEKAEFLAALMGSDGYLQSSMKKSPQSFPPIRITFNKVEEVKQNGLEYANQLKQLFEDLGIKVSRISITKGNIRKDGKKTLKFVITLSNSIPNMIKFLEKVGFRYCEKKEIEARKMLAYLKAKIQAIEERKNLYKKVIGLWKKGYSQRKISKITGISRPVIKRWIYGSTKLRVYTFPSYREWIKKRFKNNLVFERIVDKRFLKPEPLFDITVAEVHNFISDDFIVHNCHNFIPSDREVASSDAIKRLAKEGREPGIGLLVITQMPAKVHQDILSQCDLVISFRLTSKDDLQALHAVYQSYMAEEIEKFINKLPRWAGAAIILDDMLEKVFTVNIRPRLSWHAGGTATLV